MAITSTAQGAARTPPTPGLGWAYAEPGKRDLRIDLLRGAAIFAMVVDHVGGQEPWLYALTGGNHFFVSAAEAFIFLSGFVTGMIQAQVIAREGWKAAFANTVQRACSLYFMAVLLALTLPLLALHLGLSWANPLQTTSLPGYVVGVVTFQQTYYLVDILVLYALLFPCAGLALKLISSGASWLVITASWSLWLLWQYAPEALSLPGSDTVFHFASWQVIFFTALVMGAHRKQVAAFFAQLPAGAYLTWSGALFTASLLVYHSEQAVLSAVLPSRDAQSAADALFSKADVGVGRLIVFAILAAFAYSLLTIAWKPLKAILGWLLVPLGQHSLFAYCLHLFVVALFAAAGPSILGPQPSSGETALLQASGVILVWLTVMTIASFSPAKRPSVAKPAAKPAPAIAAPRPLPPARQLPAPQTMRARPLVTPRAPAMQPLTLAQRGLRPLPVAVPSVGQRTSTLSSRSSLAARQSLPAGR